MVIISCDFWQETCGYGEDFPVEEYEGMEEGDIQELLSF